MLVMTGFMFMASSSLGAVENKKVKIETYEDVILYTGILEEFGCVSDFNLVKNSDSKSEMFEKGLKIVENGAKLGLLFDQETLANYYCTEKKDFKKGLYWAKQCAEKGSGDGMHLLLNAYRKGNGVIQNTEEAFKWYFLASAAGIEFNHEFVKSVRDNSNNNIIQSAKKKAQDWMNEHPEAFFSPN
jgi:TPR repeat protein